jgi:cyclin-A
MRKQPELSLEMRSVLVDWLVDVACEYDLQQETLHLAVAYTDRFLSTMAVRKEHLQLLGISSMMIAA